MANGEGWALGFYAGERRGEEDVDREERRREERRGRCRQRGEEDVDRGMIWQMSDVHQNKKKDSGRKRMIQRYEENEEIIDKAGSRHEGL